MNSTDVIEIPVRATINESFQLIAACSKAEDVEDAVTLDASSTTVFGPFGIAAIAATIAVRKLAGRPTDLLLPRERDARAFAEEVALDNFARGVSARPGTLEVRQMHALDALYTESVADLLVHGVPGITAENVYPIQLCLNELLQNVFEWSNSRVGCFVLARWYRKTRSVRLAVVDRGIGIPAALRSKRVRGLHRANDADVIVAAVTEPRLTSRPNKVGGLGLKTIREVVCGRAGRLTVVSLTAKVGWSGEKLTKSKSPPLRGTAVEIDIRPGAPTERQDSPPIF